MTNEQVIERALFWINQACSDDELINQNKYIEKAIKTLQNTKV